MRRVLLPALVTAFLASLSAAADEPATKQLSGGGVHAYFAKEYKEAHKLLSDAAATKTEDPRVYYFRGLAHWQLGRPDEAKADFATAAHLEATASDDLHGIDKALERVQGKPRLLSEDARVAAQCAHAHAVAQQCAAREGTGGVDGDDGDGRVLAARRCALWLAAGAAERHGLAPVADRCERPRARCGAQHPPRPRSNG